MVPSRALCSLVLILVLAVGAAAQTAPSGPARFAVTEATLDNGLRVLIQEDPRNPVVAVQIFYRVGSRNEMPGATPRVKVGVRRSGTVAPRRRSPLAAPEISSVPPTQG